MKLHTYFLWTHGATSVAIGLLLVASLRTENASLLIGGTVLSLLTLVAAAWYATVRIRAGLSNLELVVIDQDVSETLRSGLIEFDQTADQIAAAAQKWESVAANNRQQAREFQAMMFLLNRRGPEREPSSEQLRGLLAGLGNTLHSHLTQIEKGAVEIEQRTRKIADFADSQGSAVTKTTAYLEHLCASMETVSTAAAQAESASRGSGESATLASRTISELAAGLQQVRSDSQACEKKLRGLCDPSQQINAIVETICDIAARTDLLALNASIESVRAGEHGKRFAMVADEVRKLTEQTTDATREITGLVDSMQLVTGESVHRISRGREQLEAQLAKAAAAETSLQQICDSAQVQAGQLHQINDSANQQLQLAKNIVTAVEQISEIAKDSRGEAESAGWTIKSLAKAPKQFQSVVDRLRQCAGPARDEQEDRPIGAAPAVPANPLATAAMTSHQVTAS